MSKSIRIPAVAKIAADLETMMEVCQRFADVALDAKDVRLAFDSLLLSCNNCLDNLADIGGKATTQDMADAECAAQMDALRDSLVGRMPLLEVLGIPAVSGGAPDDFEDCDDAIFGDEWPAYPSEDVDGYVYEMGATPIEVLGLDAAAMERYQPTPQDWSDYSAWAAVGDSAAYSEADHVAAVGHC